MTTRRTRERYAAFADFVRSREGSGRWLVLTHDNPDPDSIAAAAGLSLLLRKELHRRVTVGYGGLVGRAENQEMVKLLTVSMSHVRHLNWDHYRHVALVDTQPRTGNNQLPESIRPDAVFDHHPLRAATRSVPFQDLRIDYGATATIVAEYLQVAGLEISRSLATGLAYAIRTETQDFRREFSPADRKLYMSLMPAIDHRALGRIQTPRLSLGYFRNLHEALAHLRTVGTLVVGRLGELDQPDIVPEIADLLLRMRGKTWSLCSGVYNQRIYLSIRTTNPRADAGRLMRRLVGRRGKGGGHGMTAGGWIEIGDDDPATLQRQLAKRLARALRKPPEGLAPVDLSRH